MSRSYNRLAVGVVTAIAALGEIACTPKPEACPHPIAAIIPEGQEIWDLIRAHAVLTGQTIQEATEDFEACNTPEMIDLRPGDYYQAPHI